MTVNSQKRMISFKVRAGYQLNQLLMANHLDFTVHKLLGICHINCTFTSRFWLFTVTVYMHHLWNVPFDYAMTATWCWQLSFFTLIWKHGSISQKWISSNWSEKLQYSGFYYTLFWPTQQCISTANYSVNIYWIPRASRYSW